MSTHSRPTDYVPECFDRQQLDAEQGERDGKANLAFETQQFQTVEEPFYVVLQPVNGKIELLAAYHEGRITDLNLFVRFLQNPLSAKQ